MHLMTSKLNLHYLMHLYYDARLNWTRHKSPGSQGSFIAGADSGFGSAHSRAHKESKWARSSVTLERIQQYLQIRIRE